MTIEMVSGLVDQITGFLINLISVARNFILGVFPSELSDIILITVSVLLSMLLLKKLADLGKWAVIAILAVLIFIALKGIGG